MYRRILVLGILLAISVVNWAMAECPEQITGAVWTTTAACGKVNGNIYLDKNDVYLSGGPHTPSGPGLPLSDDSIYVFQVTDPSGKVLLSCDPIQCRRVKVNANGVMSAVVSGTAAGNSYICLKPGGNQNVLNPCQHPFVNCDPATGRISVRLMPYADTPNNGGEYKAWITPLCRYNPSDPHAYFGFIERYCKTDNFKVRQRPKQIRLFGRKFFDRNANGIQDDLVCEPGLAGWPITLSGTSSGTILPQTTTTGAFGDYGFLVTAGTYTVTEAGLPNNVNWSHTTPTSLGGIVVLSSDTEKGPYNFGNRYQICGTKFYDKNGNGVQDGDDYGIPEWGMSLTGSEVCSTPQDTVTDNFGHYCFVVNSGSYCIKEADLPSSKWEHTTPESLCFAALVDFTDSTVVGPFDFGNRLVPESCLYCTPNWGCHGPGCADIIRDKYFDSVFPNGILLGDPDGPYDWDLRYALVLTSGLMVELFLPQSGTPKPLSTDEVNPLISSAGTLAGELVDATMNVAYNDAGLLCSLKVATCPSLADLVYAGCVADSLLGKTVGQVLTAADRVLSGEFGFSMAPNDPILIPAFGTTTINKLVNALAVLNAEFDDCCQPGAGCLALPGVGVSAAGLGFTPQPELQNVNRATTVLGNSPNPFNLRTTIFYSLASEGKVELTIYNIRGQKVRTLVEDYQSAGHKSIVWDGTNDGGQPVSSGVYFFRLKTGQFSQTKKMTLLK